jgi:hypothetical protein
VNQDSVDIRQTQVANTASIMLADGALALFVIYVVIVAFDILPPRLFDPTWMINFALSLSGNIAIPLAALVFLHVAAWLNPLSNSIQARRNFFARIARWVTLGFLLLIPLIGYATWAGSNSIKIQNAIQANNAQVTTKRLLQVIDAATTPNQLQLGLIALSGPTIPNELLRLPLSSLKDQSRIIVNQTSKSFLLNLDRLGSERFLPFYIQSLKAFLLALVGAAASAALAWNPIKNQSMLDEVVMGDFRQIRLILNPKQFIANYKLNQEQRALSQDARKRVLEIEKQRQVEARKNAAATRKQSLERKREMEKYIKEEKRKRSNRID